MGDDVVTLLDLQVALVENHTAHARFPASAPLRMLPGTSGCLELPNTVGECPHLALAGVGPSTRVAFSLSRRPQWQMPATAPGFAD